MIKVFVGFDRVETIAYHVLCHSIIRRSTEPVEIVPLNRENLRHSYWRTRGELDSTDFSNSRWIIPHLCGFQGEAIFMDCDMLCLGDIADLYHQWDPSYAVQVKKHDHVPDSDKKFLGKPQTVYNRKNWSSLMLFNNTRCTPLTQHIVNSMSPGLWFHRFEWLPDEEIGEIEGPWNHLVGYDSPNADALLPHFTEGGPWHGYTDVEFADEWFAEFEDMMQGDNPVAWRDGLPNGNKSDS